MTCLMVVGWDHYMNEKSGPKYLFFCKLTGAQSNHVATSAYNRGPYAPVI